MVLVLAVSFELGEMTKLGLLVSLKLSKALVVALGIGLKVEL